MATILIDSSVLIGRARGQEAARDAIAKLAGHTPVLCDIVLGEVLIGSRNRKEYDELHNYLRKTYGKLPFTVEVSERFQELLTGKERLLHGHLSDHLIAATAIAHNTPLLTLNKKDFAKLEGLKLL